MRRLPLLLVAALSLLCSAGFAVGAVEYIGYNHSGDCDFGCETLLDIAGDGVAEMYLGGNRYATDNPPCVGFFRGSIAPQELAALEALFRDPLFLQAEETDAGRTDSVFRTLTFRDSKLYVTKTFAQPKSPQTKAHLEKIYARLDAIRAELLAGKPVVGLKVEVGRVTSKRSAVEVEFFLCNVGTEAVVLPTAPQISAELRDASDSGMELTPANAGDDAARDQKLSPGGKSLPIRLRADLSALPSPPAVIVWDCTFDALFPGHDEPQRMAHVGKQPFTSQ